MIGIAYSVGFLVGPMIGAYFSTIAPKVRKCFESLDKGFQDAFFYTPAIFSIALTLLQFVIVAFLLPETLITSKRVRQSPISQPVIFRRQVNKS